MRVEPEVSFESAAEALRQNPTMFESLLANLPGMAYRCKNDEHWTMLFVSEGCRGLTGYDPNDLLGNRRISYEQLIHPADRERVRAEVERALSRGVRFELTYRIIKMDGEERWVTERGSLGGGSRIQEFLEGIVIDITHHKSVEQALAQSERTLETIFDNSIEFIGLLDVEGRIVRANRTAMNAVGVGPEELLGRYFWDTPWWTHSASERERLRHALASAAKGELIRYETTHPTADGRLLNIDFSITPVKDAAGKVVMLVPEGRDVTERLQSELLLRESETKFATAFRASPSSLTISELESGRYVDVNAGFERLSGYTREEVLGRTSFELGLWKDQRDRDRLLDMLSSEGRVRDLEVSFVRRDGSEVVARCSTEIIEIAGLAYMLNTIEDVTEQRRAERAQRTLAAQVRQIQKLDALGKLAGGIAHDFNNVLGAILAFADLLNLDAEEPARVHEHVEEIRLAGERAKHLVRQILTFSRQQKPERKPMRLQETLEETIGLLRSALPRSVRIETLLDPNAAEVLADATQIHQVVMNLCTNAAHALPERRGSIAVRLETLEFDSASARAKELSSGRYACISVRDDGIGMDAETLKRIYEPFFTTKASGEGTGLGLSVVHGIVEDHDASIRVETELGRGTTFYVYFPEYVSLQLGEELERLSLPRGRGESVLLVDDERGILRALGELLERLGYRVSAHQEPAQALAAFRAAPSAFDVLVTDFVMPAMSGVELAEALRALRPGLPMVLATGNRGLTAPASGNELGFAAVLEKPLSPRAVATTLRRVLGLRSLASAP